VTQSFSRREWMVLVVGEATVIGPSYRCCSSNVSRVRGCFSTCFESFRRTYFCKADNIHSSFVIDRIRHAKVFEVAQANKFKLQAVNAAT
jgi:hypothetical protein